MNTTRRGFFGALLGAIAARFAELRFFGKAPVINSLHPEITAEVLRVLSNNCAVLPRVKRDFGRKIGRTITIHPPLRYRVRAT